jgi:hypothetical protein
MECFLAVAFYLLVLSSANSVFANCNTTQLHDSSNATRVLDRLQQLKEVDSISLESSDGIRAVIHGTVNLNSSSNLTIGAVWQAMSCSAVKNETWSSPITNPWMLNVYRFAVEVWNGDGGNISLTTFSAPELHIIPGFMVLYSVNVTVSSSVTVSQRNENVRVSADGLWHLGRVTIQVVVEWSGPSFSLSFPNIPQSLNISAVLKTVNDIQLWDAITWTIAKAGLKEMLNLKVDEMNAEMRNMTAGKDVILFNALGNATVADFGLTATRFLLVLPLHTKSRIDIVTEDTSSLRNGSQYQTITQSPATITVNSTEAIPYTVVSRENNSRATEKNSSSHTVSTTTTGRNDVNGLFPTVVSSVLTSYLDKEVARESILTPSALQSEGSYNNTLTTYQTRISQPTSVTVKLTSGRKSNGRLDATTPTHQSITSITTSLVPSTIGVVKRKRRSASIPSSYGQQIKAKNDAIAILVSELHANSTTLSTLVKKYTTINISQFPPLQAARHFRGILTVSSAGLSTTVATELEIDPLAFQCGDIEEGLTAVVSVSLPLSSPTIFQIRWDNNKPKARLCRHGFTSLTPVALMTAFFPSSLPSLFSLLHSSDLMPSSLQEVNPTTVTYDIDQNSVDFELKVDEVKILVPGFAQVLISNFTITIPLDNHRLSSMKSSVDLNLGEFQWPNARFTIEENCIEVYWTTDKLNIQDVLQKLNTTFLPLSLASPLQSAGFLDFMIYEFFAHLKIQRNSTRFLLRIGGNAVIRELSNVKVEGIIQQTVSSSQLSQGKKRRNAFRQIMRYPLALGLEIEDVSVPLILKMLTGNADFEAEPFLPTRATVAISVSSLDMADTSFSYGLLNHVRPVTGISFYTEFKFQDCSGDTLCELTKSGSQVNLVIVLQGRILSPCQFSLTNPLPDVIFNPVKINEDFLETNSLVMKDASLEFKGSGICNSDLYYSVSMMGNIEIDFTTRFLGMTDRYIMLFKTQVTKTSTSLTARAAMEDWHCPFVLPFLAIGNIELQLKRIPTVPTLATASVEFKLGICGNGHEIFVKGFLAIDLQDTTKWYICGHFSAFSLASLLKAFGIWPSSLPLPRDMNDAFIQTLEANGLTIPDVILDVGFPKGLTVSYSTIDSEWPLSDICRPRSAGFSLSGELTILGITALVEIEITEQMVFIQGSLKPINLFNGVLEIYKQSSDSSRGPAITVEVHKPLKLKEIAISGYLSLLRGALSAKAQISVTDKEVATELTAKLFVCRTNIKLHGEYASRLSDVPFLVTASVHFTEFARIEEEVEGIIRSVADIATKFVEALQKGLEAVMDKLNKAQDFLTARQRDFDNAKRKLQGPLNTLNSAKRKVDGLCRIRSCKSTCVGCPTWNGCCRKRWGVCIPCVGWNGCCTKVSDPICTGANSVCRGLRATALLALETAKTAYRAVLLPFEAAKLALEAAKLSLETVKKSFEAAKRALEAAKKTMALGLDFAARLSGGKLFNINSIEFERELIQLSSTVDATAVVVLFGGTHNLQIKLALDTMDIAELLIELIKPGTLKIFHSRRRKSIDSTFAKGDLDNLVRNRSNFNLNDERHLQKSTPVAADSEMWSTNITEEFNQWEIDTLNAKRQTVDYLAEELTRSEVNMANILRQSKIRKSLKKIQKQTKTPNKQDICIVSEDLAELVMNVAKDLRSVHTRWIQSYSQYSKQVRMHQLERRLLQTFRNRITEIGQATVGQEGHEAVDVNRVLMERFYSDMRQEEVLLGDMSRAITKWDHSARKQFLRMDKFGGTILLREIELGFHQTFGVLMFDYMREKAQFLQDSAITEKLNVISGETGRKSLTEMMTLLEIMLVDIQTFQSNKNCTIS